MFGLRPGENYYYGQDGWDATYVPLLIQRHPFLIGADDANPDSNTLTMCLDSTSPFLSESDGIALFDENGNGTDFLVNRNELLTEVFQGERVTVRGQEVDFINPQPQVTLVEDVSGIDGVEFEASLGPVWEHFDFNHDDPRLQNQFVRQAIAQGINRDAIVETVVRPLNPDATPLGNSIWMSTSAYYEDHFNERFPYDPAAAEALLVDNGCTKGGDGIYECDGERLSFTWTTTAGNEGRELQFELAQADLAVIGIEVTAKFGPASEVFADAYINGGADQWQVFNFAWVGSPEPAGGNTLYYCEGANTNGFGDINNLRYCNEEVDALVKSTDSIVDPAERAAVYNQADDLWLAEVPMIPMYQKPSFLAWDSAITGVVPNANNITDTWNVGAWGGRILALNESVIVTGQQITQLFFNELLVSVLAGIILGIGWIFRAQLAPWLGVNVDGGCALGSSGTTDTGSRGRATRKRAPTPGGDSSSAIRPPWSSTISLTIASPSPEPTPRVLSTV